MKLKTQAIEGKAVGINVRKKVGVSTEAAKGEEKRE